MGQHVAVTRDWSQGPHVQCPPCPTPVPLWTPLLSCPGTPKRTLLRSGQALWLPPPSPPWTKGETEAGRKRGSLRFQGSCRVRSLWTQLHAAGQRAVCPSPSHRGPWGFWNPHSCAVRRTTGRFGTVWGRVSQWCPGCALSSGQLWPLRHFRSTLVTRDGLSSELPYM